MATLAAFDLVRSCKSLRPDDGPATDPICYTFGAPRLGNHAFARLYNTTVPNTWHVINDQVSSWSFGGLLAGPQSKLLPDAWFCILAIKSVPNGISATSVTQLAIALHLRCLY